MVCKPMPDSAEPFHLAEVMSIRHDSASTTVEYYVHYSDFNKRLDEWVTVDRMDLSTVAAAAVAAGAVDATKAGSKKSTSTSSAAIKTTPKKTTPASVLRGRKKTDDSRQVTIKDELHQPPPARQQEQEQRGEEAKTAKLDEIEHLRHGGSMTRRLDEIARVKNIDWIEFGRHRLDCWYFSPYPPELINAHGATTIYLCELCLVWHGKREELIRHCQKCIIKCPPGAEIARQGNLSFFELDGHRQKDYTRRLCLLSKLFLDHKTLFYDVDPFMYYVLCENDAFGSHLIGYFSKEKDSVDGYNVACILTLPQFQRRGFGRLLIEFSYELTRREGRVGSPEKPLSDLGLLSYRSYWAEVLVEFLINAADTNAEVSIDTLSRSTGFTPDDIMHTLQMIDAIRYRRGQHVIVLSERAIREWERARAKIKVRFDPKCLRWTPPVFSQAQLRFL